jgi:hypothetical protein
MRWGLPTTGRRRAYQALAAIAGLGLAASGAVVLTTGTATAIGVNITVGNAGDPATGVAANCASAATCTLRDAFAAADATGGDANINVALPSRTTVTTTNGSLDYHGGTGGTHALTLNGNGITVNQPGSTQAVDATAGSHVTVNDMTLKSGFTGIGASIPLTVTNTTIVVTVPTGAVTAQGIFAFSTADVSNSNITATEGATATADATGVVAATSLTFTNSTVLATAQPGKHSAYGLELNGGAGSVTAVGSTITAVADNGAGIIGPELVTVKNSTVTGSGFYGIDAHTVVLAYATVMNNASNAASANIHTTDLTSFGSVVAKAGNSSPNCIVNGTSTSQGYNYTDDANGTTSCKFNQSTDHVGASNDPQVGALASNGGPTQTRLPATGSPLIDAIPAAACQTGNASGIVTDQRTLARPSNGACDIGAVEVQVAAVVGTPKLTG